MSTPCQSHSILYHATISSHVWINARRSFVAFLTSSGVLRLLFRVRVFSIAHISHTGDRQSPAPRAPDAVAARPRAASRTRLAQDRRAAAAGARGCLGLGEIDAGQTMYH